MDMKLVQCIVLLLITSAVEADVFKCEVNGKTIFSDAPCAEHAETIEMKVYQPKAEDIKKQQQTTQQYQRDSKHNAFLALRAQNETLEKQIIGLQKEHDQKLKAMRGKTYRSGNYVATKEHGLFKRMRQMSVEYLARIEQIRKQIKQNEQKMAELQSGQ